MDPKYADETFASTVTGIEELRKARRDDWPEWRRTLVNAARAGARMEQELRNVAAAVEQCIRKTPFDTLTGRVDELENAAKRRRGLINWLLSHFWQILVIVLTAFLAHRWK